MIDEKLRENPDLAVWWYLARSFNLVSLSIQRCLAHRNLTGPQFGVLCCLDEAGGSLPLSQIGERLLVTCANITGVVDRLQRDGHVVRERSQEDRRVTLARITPEGRELCHAAQREFLAHLRTLMEPMGEEECRALAAQFERTYLHLKERVSL